MSSFDKFRRGQESIATNRMRMQFKHQFFSRNLGVNQLDLEIIVDGDCGIRRRRYSIQINPFTYGFVSKRLFHCHPFLRSTTLVVLLLLVLGMIVVIVTVGTHHLLKKDWEKKKEEKKEIFLGVLNRVVKLFTCRLNSRKISTFVFWPLYFWIYQRIYINSSS